MGAEASAGSDEAPPTKANEVIKPLPDPNAVLAETNGLSTDELRDLRAAVEETRKSESAAELLQADLSPSELKRTLTMKINDPDDPDAAAHAEFRVMLASGNPLNSTFWYLMKHPISRMFAAVFIMFLNFFVYLGDPASYSVSMSYGTLLGDIYHGFFQPDDAAFMVPRIIFMVLVGFCGMALGGVIQRRLLRDYFRIEMFGYDPMQGNDPERKPEQSYDGGLLVSILTTALCWYFGLMIYNEFLIACGAHEDHHLDEGMHNWTFAGYNLVLAGLFAFVSDWWNIITVIDQMLQDFDKSAARKGNVATASTGFKAYGKGHPSLIKLGHWWEDNRLVITRVWLLVGWGTIVPLMIHNFNLNMRIVENRLDVAMGDGWFWATWNTEFTRMFVASAVACMNMLIVMQDWDFPNLNGEDVKIAATDLTEVNIEWKKIKACGPMLKWIFDHMTFYISGKWFNYINIFIAISFDWSYWFMTALVFRPCDYAQFWDSETGYIFTMDDRHLALEHAGAAAAKDCPWFTDNKLQNDWRQNGTDPYVVRVATGTFTGVYTLDEDDVAHYGGWAAVLWLLCVPPIMSYIALGYVVGTHDKLVGTKKKKMIQKWLAEREELTHQDKADVLDELKETYGAVNNQLLIALEKFEKTQCNCITAAKSDVASDEGGSAAVELATAKPGEQTEVIVGTNADLNC